MKKICRNWNRLSATRDGSPGIAMIRDRLMDAATNTSPVRVAAAPACTSMSAVHSVSGGMEIC